MRKTLAAFAVIISCALLLSSCVVAEKLTLTGDYTQSKAVPGKNHVDLSVDDFFVGVVEDLSDWENKGNNDPIIDVAIQDFVKNLEASSVTSSIKFVETGYNTYMGDFAFTNFPQLLIDLSNNQADQSVVTMSSKNGKTHVEISINMDNYEQLTKMIPFLADPNFEVYGPLYNNDLTEEEYLEMVSFILGEQCPDSIASSSIKIQVVAPKAISAHNGKLRNSKTVEFSFPLIDFLLLHESIDFYLEY
ncbi:MAG: hypothetical protein LIR25_05685 [bacterium]|nr:hypothetical protein [Spirochaetales bacterium]MDT3390057.1 hypothetical protein [bacterium]